MVLTVQLPPELEQRLTQAAAAQGVPTEEYLVRVLEQQLQPAGRRALALNLLRERLATLEHNDLDAGDDEFLLALDANRPADAPLYPPEKKGITW